MKKYQELKESFEQHTKNYLYGAGVVAFGAYKAIQYLFHITIEGFLVTEKKERPSQIEGIPVIEIGQEGIDRTGSLIVIAAPEVYHDDMERMLKAFGYHDYIKLDSQIEYELMGRYLKQVRGLKLIEDSQLVGHIKIADKCRVYMAVNPMDKRLKGIYEEKTWVRKIQVGAALTTKRIAALTDEGKDSLSSENVLYGELTAAYYIWKHNLHDVTGVFHYRRVLEVTDEQLGLICAGKADVILPLPFVCTPDASGQYERYLLPEDIEVMLEVLKEKERFAEIESILKMPYLYNYNILIARKGVFDDYCSWLFPLLKEITYRCEKVKRNRLPRYIGRIGEVLTSLYFTRNEKKLNIVHAKKNWRI